MKLVLCLIVTAFTMTVFQGVARGDDKREEKPRFKGVELYSWKDKGGDWLYVLATGTNRQKTEKEVKEELPQIKGTEELKKALTRLAVAEDVMWSDHRLSGFEFPSEGTRKEIERAAKEAKINLTVDFAPPKPVNPATIKDKVSVTLGEEFAIEFKRDGDRLLQPSKSQGARANKAAVKIKLGVTSASPFPPPREGATRPFLSVENNFDNTLCFRALVRLKGSKEFFELSENLNPLPAGEISNRCWGFDDLVEEVVLYEFQLSDK